MTNFDILLGEKPLVVEKPDNRRKKPPAPQSAKYRRAYLRAKKLNPQSLLFKGAKKRARRKGIEFSITRADVPIPKFCPILGIPLFPSYDGVAKDNSPSIDRIDATKGYVPGNVMIISFRANTLKNNATVEELKKVVEFLCKT